MSNKVLLISEETLKKYSLINDNIDGKYILSTIQVTQDVDLEGLIGKNLLQTLCDKVSDGSIYNTVYQDLLDDYITDYLIWECMANLQVGVNYKIANAGTFNSVDTQKSSIDYKSGQLLQEQYKQNANSYAVKLKNYLAHNSSLFPEYYSNCGCEQPDEVPTYGLFLGDIRRHNCNCE